MSPSPKAKIYFKNMVIDPDDLPADFTKQDLEDHVAELLEDAQRQAAQASGGPTEDENA